MNNQEEKAEKTIVQNNQTQSSTDSPILDPKELDAAITEEIKKIEPSLTEPVIQKIVQKCLIL